MGGGNGAKAATKRARNMKAEGPKANSILKDKDKMMNIICQVCRSTFMCTTKKPELEMHASNKHPKETFAKCFPMVQ